MHSQIKCFLQLSFLAVFLVLAGCANQKQNMAAHSVSPPKLDGVNFGGVFVLEDWFFSSNHLAHNVSTPCSYKDTGVASSHIFTGNDQSENFHWTSETDLITKLLKAGHTQNQVAEFFQKHRDGYFSKEIDGPRDLNENFMHLRELGVDLVRLPVTWALTYPGHSYTIDPGNGGRAVTIPATDKVVLIPDPFYPNDKWASIPITQIEAILKAASAHGIKILLEVHAYAGGAGDGTFNGVWPKPPQFWSTGSDEDGRAIYEKNFQVIFNNLAVWAEGLFLRKDQSYANGLAGLSPMNEPAHLMGIDPARCDKTTSWGITSPEPVLRTLALAVDAFKASFLPEKNVKLYVNVIETMFEGGEPLRALGQWWRSVTSEDERGDWAVLDIHHYIAWDAEFNNCINEHLLKSGENTYTISPEGFRKVKESTHWFSDLRQKLGVSGKTLLSTSEFSASTHSDTWQSCASGVARSDKNQPLLITNYKEYRNAFVDAQISVANSERIQAIFWTWMLPYNDNYKNEWALYSICSGADAPVFCESSALGLDRE